MSHAGILIKISGRILSEDSEPYYDALDVVKPTNVIVWEGNNIIFDEEEDTQPPRPYVAVQFADIPLSFDAGRKMGTTDMVVKVVQDNFHRNREVSEDLDKFLDKLIYTEVIESLLDNYDGIQTIGVGAPNFVKNLIIQDIRIRVKTDRTRSRLPWKASEP